MKNKVAAECARLPATDALKEATPFVEAVELKKLPFTTRTGVLQI